MLVWTGMGIIACSGLLGALAMGAFTDAGLVVVLIAGQGVTIFFIVAAVPLARIPADELVPRPITLAVSVTVATACLWTLTFPIGQWPHEDTHVAISSLVGQGAIDATDVGRFSTISWSSLMACLLTGLVIWPLCLGEARRRRMAVEEP